VLLAPGGGSVDPTLLLWRQSWSRTKDQRGKCSLFSTMKNRTVQVPVMPSGSVAFNQSTAQM